MSPAVLEASSPAIPNRTYTVADLADLFGVHKATIADWSKTGILPPPRRIGRLLRWTPGDIAPLLANRLDEATA
jgi:predicted DNA-binding transcriptional regulator AlpA